MGVVTGAVRTIYTETGKVVKSLDEFETDGRYVCAGAEKFSPENRTSHEPAACQNVSNLTWHCYCSTQRASHPSAEESAQRASRGRA